MATKGRSPVLTSSLRQLARLYGIQTAYFNFFKRRTDASGEAVLEAARLLGAPVANPDDAADAVQARTRAIWRQPLEPVVVAPSARQPRVDVRWPADRADERVRCRLRLEDGTVRNWDAHFRPAAGAQIEDLDGVRYLGVRLTLPGRLPYGYHELSVRSAARRGRCLLIVAPPRAFSTGGRSWGAFLPLYALRTDQSLGGVGTFTDLQRLREWVGGHGGSIVSILPVLAAHPTSPFDPSPYAPSSRLFWNELYVDPRQAPELADCPRAERLLASTAFRQEVATLRAAPVVDYTRHRSLNRQVLQELARCLGASRNRRYAELQRYVTRHRALEDYAAFMAVLERRQVPWSDWPEPLRSGVVGPEDRDQDVVFYHQYVQWLAEQQLASFSAAAGDKPGLYLDLPLGVHADGYDTWRHRDAFALGACGGAPPDAVFTRGQNWDFPPLHPEAIRAQGYRYLIACLRHQLAHASCLRIDHVMALHRLYWIPRGWPASEGVYVRYRSEELYAILCLESHRHRATIVGENLGTVPSSVNAGLARHRIRRMYVVQYEAQPTPARPLKRVPADTVASLNTHDMPPFAAYLQEMDLQDRLELGLLPSPELRREQIARRRIRRALSTLLRRQGWLPRATDDASLTRAVIAWLAASRAAVVLINLEDLWLETASQNLPGTGIERPNWRRKARYSLEEFASDAGVVQMVGLLNHLRSRGRRGG